jgi:hypothetical protein
MSKVSLYISAGEILRVSSSFFCFKVKYPVFIIVYKGSFLVSWVAFCRARSVVVNDVLRGMWANGSRSLCRVMSQSSIAWADQRNSSNSQALCNIL